MTTYTDSKGRVFNKGDTVYGKAYEYKGLAVEIDDIIISPNITNEYVIATNGRACYVDEVLTKLEIIKEML